MPRSIDRRTLLRGALGTVVGLPLLECMLNRNGTALAGGLPIPRRYFQFHCPTSLVTSGSRQEAMTPTKTGFDYDVRPVLQPLDTHGVTGDVSVISGLFSAPLDVPGGYNVDYHGKAVYAVMTGQRHGFQSGWRPEAWSADQLVAQHLKAPTKFPYLYFQIDSVVEGSSVCFERQDGLYGKPGEQYRMIQPQVSPANAYLQMFTGFEPSDGPDPKAELERRLRFSSLSYAKDQISSLQQQLGARDQQTLDEHLTGIRDLERRMAETFVGGEACRDPELSGDDPTPLAASLPDQAARAALFVELIELAFACDLTRVVTLAGASAMTGSGMRNAAWNDVGGLHGEVQHEGPQSGLDGANRWFVDVYAQLVARFAATPEGEGSVLDNTAAVYVMEGGKGLASDAQRSGDGGGDSNHSVDNMVMMLAGRAGGLRPGQHVSLVGRDLHPAVVFNSAFQALGMAPRLGEIEGSVDALFG